MGHYHWYANNSNYEIQGRICSQYKRISHTNHGQKPVTGYICLPIPDHSGNIEYLQMLVPVSSIKEGHKVVALIHPWTTKLSAFQKFCASIFDQYTFLCVRIIWFSLIKEAMSTTRYICCYRCTHQGCI